jgi:hypothetical protein
MDKQLRAIPTFYRNYRFRSRLEARWGVYWDALGVEWDYEPEGYDLDGTRYLPDFWLKSVQMWAEIKAVPFTPEEKRKCAVLARLSRHPVLMLDGLPEWREYLAFQLGHEGDELFQVGYHLSDEYVQTEQRFFWMPSGLEEPSERVLAAVAAAKQARFEHGEAPSLVPVRMQDTAAYRRLSEVAHLAPAHVCADCELPITDAQVSGFDLAGRLYWCESCALKADARRFPEDSE